MHLIKNALCVGISPIGGGVPPTVGGGHFDHSCYSILCPVRSFLSEIKARNFAFTLENNELQNGKPLKYQKLTLNFKKVNFPI